MVMIGIDPHKRTHTAVAIDRGESVLGERLVHATGAQVPELLEWAKRLDGGERVWAIESAGGLGYLLAQQLLAAGEQVVDIPATLASGVRLLGTGRSEKNDPNDARSVAIAALRAAELDLSEASDHLSSRLGQAWASVEEVESMARRRRSDARVKATIDAIAATVTGATRTASPPPLRNRRAAPVTTKQAATMKERWIHRGNGSAASTGIPGGSPRTLFHHGVWDPSVDITTASPTPAQPPASPSGDGPPNEGPSV